MFRAGSFAGAFPPLLRSNSASEPSSLQTKVVRDGRDEESAGDSSVAKSAAKPRGGYRAQASCIAYMLSSTSMVLMNKLVLSGFGFHSTNCLLLYQTIWCVVIVKALQCAGCLKLERLTPQLCMMWLPVNLIFVGMIWTSFFALRYLGVAMMTVLKNSTNLLVVVGDIVFFQRRQPTLVWVCLLLIIVSAVCGAATDLSFHALGYTWQVFNCFFTAAYSLYMRRVMNKVSTITENGRPLDEFSMVLLNNLLSIPLISILCVANQEIPKVMLEPALKDPYFILAASLSGVLSLGISFSSLWFLSETSPTTYSIVGSLNKIPTAIAGLVFFHVPTSLPNMLSISVGLAAGVCFTQAKTLNSGK
mmetsp:Transcript_48434/g.90187  ORF Transcript_48434/g.90187 Transcript_48434/m.90187 type:complete len:361 (+) Transcript_48434:527-1609(+)